ncbi:MFS transporter [Psychrobacillus sp. NPDC093200]|uniref:MFS transporter n=1 Tax=Psychrobacillus sp. NPDC093200 TaxID=3390656 RepID=UPI003CFD6A83
MKQSVVFHNKSFLVLWIGNIISELGGVLGTLCNSFLIYQLTNSTLALSSMWLLYFIPSLILQLFIGPFIDRWSRKWIMILSQWARGIIFILPLIALASNQLEVWHIYLVQIVVGLITPIYTPANQAITPTIVPEELLTSANAYNDGAIRLMTFVVPFVGGMIIEFLGLIPSLLVVCLTLLTSGILLLSLQEKRNAFTVRKTWLEQFTEGILYFFKQRIIVWLGIFLAFVQFGVGVTMVITLPYITDELSGSYTEVGYFMASFPLGYVIGTMLVGKVKARSRRMLMLGSLAVGGLTFIFLCFNTSIVLALLTEGIAGIAMAFFGVHNITIFQKSVPNELMGKVASVRLLIIRGAMPVGVLVGGLLSETWGIRPLYFFIGSIICTVSIIGLTFPYFKSLNNSSGIEGN